MPMNSNVSQDETKYSKANERKNDTKMISMMQSILKFIENAVLMFSGHTKDLLPQKENKRTIEVFSDWIDCGSVTVQQAVSLILNNYRIGMEEHLFHLSKINRSNKTSKLQASIVRMINRLETAVWENDWYEVESIFHKEIRDVDEQGTLNNDCVNFTVDENKMMMNSCSESTIDTQPDIATIETNYDINVQLLGAENIQNNVTNTALMVEDIDESSERRFLEDLKNNGDAIFHGDLNDRDTEGALQMMLRDEMFVDVVEEREEQTTSNQNIQKTDTCNNHNNGNIFMQKKSHVPDALLKKPLQEKETDLFYVMVRHRCHEVGACLTLEQKEMVQRSISHCCDLISMQSISAVDAFRHVEQLMKLFL